MAKATFTIKDFYARFPDDAACLDHLMKVRYGEVIECPKCRKLGRFAKLAKTPAYACSWCGHHIHPMKGTPFARTHVPLQKWFYAMYLFTTTRHGVPAKELQRQLGVSYPTAFRMAHEIRKYMGFVDGDPDLQGRVEVDETYVGGEQSREEEREKGSNKTIVMGMLQRGDRITTRIIRDTRRRTLEREILTHIKEGSWINTDTMQSYAKLQRIGYWHESVNHDAGEYVRGAVHVNSLEGFWKRALKGTHVHVSRKHLGKYLGEFEFRYNMRKSPELMFLRLLMSFEVSPLHKGAY